MKFAVLQFPGSNCDHDCFYALKKIFNQQVRYVWHKETRLDSDEVIIIPGGFSYGDYLRCGAIARFSPIMQTVQKAAQNGQPIIGICNGFQILCEAGLLPGALIRNTHLKFVCKHVLLKVESTDTPFTSAYNKGDILSVPIAHGEGRYTADPETLETLEAQDQIIFRYVDASCNPTPEANPNGAQLNIAGICNAQRNILGMMPHPERACEKMLGSADGMNLFKSIINHSQLIHS